MKNKAKEILERGLAMIIGIMIGLVILGIINIFIFQFNFWIRPSEPKFKMPELSSENIDMTIYLYDEITTPIRRACYDNGYMEQCVSDLWAIAMTESSIRPNIISTNTNGTADLGLFGINTIHKVELKCLADTYCSASWVINKLEQHGYNEDRINALGCYHSKTPSIKARYIKRINQYLIK